MNETRLLKLADFLEKLLPDFFDLNVWYHKRECGMVGCAGGWATTIEEFKKDGLQLHFGRPFIDGHSGHDALAYFFQISIQDSSYLFSPLFYSIHRDKDPKFVAERIRSFVEANKKTL